MQDYLSRVNATYFYVLTDVLAIYDLYIVYPRIGIQSFYIFPFLDCIKIFEVFIFLNQGFILHEFVILEKIVSLIDKLVLNIISLMFNTNFLISHIIFMTSIKKC